MAPKHCFVDKNGPFFVKYRKNVQDTDENAIEARAATVRLADVARKRGRRELRKNN